MSILFDQMLERVGALPAEEQDAVASQILSMLDDEEVWSRSFASKPDLIRRMADAALSEHEKGLTISLDNPEALD